MLPVLGWVLIPDCWALTGPDTVHGYAGSSLSVICRYKKSYRDNTKFWCKQSQNTFFCSPSSLIKSDSDMKVEVGGVSIEDKKRYKYFIVTMDNLQVADSGIYQCGIEHWLTDTRHDVTVTVFPAPISKPEETSVSMEPSSPDPSKKTTTDFKKPNLSLQEGSNKPDVILVNCIIVIVSLLLLATVMLVIMTRKKRTGSFWWRKKETKPSNIVTVYNTVVAPKENLVPDHPTSTNRMGPYCNVEITPESNGERIHSQRKALEKRNEVTYATLMISDPQQDTIYANVDVTPNPGLPQPPTQDVFYTEVKKKS